MTAAATPFDLADVPAADPADLARLMSILIRNGHGLALLEGVERGARDAAETEFCSTDDIGGRTGAVAIVRFRALMQAFATPSFVGERLQRLFLDHGLALLPSLFRVAAAMRLNAERGFNPQRLLWSVAARQSQEAGPLQRRLEPEIVAAARPGGAQRRTTARHPGKDAPASSATVVFYPLSRAEQRVPSVSHSV